MPRPDNSFTSLAGVPVHYDRLPDAPYGTRGKPFTFYCIDPFEQKLHACFAEVWTVCPLGRPDTITSAGAWVDKPPVPGSAVSYHGIGRAFDLDGVFWPTRTFVTKMAWEAGGADRRFYLGLEAILHKHFSTILNYLYNLDHHDHLHIDDESEVGFNPPQKVERYSLAYFLQAALTYVLGIPTPINGVYDQPTRDGLHKANAGDPSILKTWFAFLDRIAQQGLATHSGETT